MQSSETPSPTSVWTAAEHAFDAERALWRAWAELGAHASPFLRRDFFALQEPLLAGERIVAAVFRNGELAGALPLVRNGRMLASLASDHAPIYDYLGDPGGIEALWHALHADPAWDTIVLERVPATSPLLTRLPGLALRDLCVTSVKPGSRCPYFALPGHEAQLPAKLRQNLRRWTRKLGDVRLERVAGYSRSTLDEGMLLEGMAWKDAAGTSIDSELALRHFYRALARLAARRGELGLYFLRVGARRIAFLFALEQGRTLYALKTGYHPAFAAFGPGHLLFSLVARNAEERGFLDLRFMGKEDEWKRRWTELTHDQATLVIYRPTVRGAATLLGRELLKPRLSPATLARAHAARRELALRTRHCQRNDIVGVHTPLQRLVGQLTGGLGIRSGMRRVLAEPASPKPRLGAPSRFAVGQWVRIMDADRVRATLDADDKLRGLAFVPAQWSSCGRIYRVQKPTRRIVDDHGQMRAVARTVLLEGVTCDGHGEGLGCGRHCPLMFRDEWLEPADGPERSIAAEPTAWARVRALADIEATLDRKHRRDGITFMAEMARFAGKRLPVVRRLPRVFEHDRWTPTRGPVYLLEGTFCSGAALGEEGPCDRACALLWHGDWLMVEPA